MPGSRHRPHGTIPASRTGPQHSSPPTSNRSRDSHRPQSSHPRRRGHGHRISARPGSSRPCRSPRFRSDRRQNRSGSKHPLRSNLHPWSHRPPPGSSRNRPCRRPTGSNGPELIPRHGSSRNRRCPRPHGSSRSRPRRTSRPGSSRPRRTSRPGSSRPRRTSRPGSSSRCRSPMPGDSLRRRYRHQPGSSRGHSRLKPGSRPAGNRQVSNWPGRIVPGPVGRPDR